MKPTLWRKNVMTELYNVNNIKPKEATAIINSLLGGVVPKLGVQHIAVGRSQEIYAFINALNDVKNGHSLVKFWIGEFGSGKSFMLNLNNTIALKQKFVCSNADFTPSSRLYSTDGKALALYSSIMDNLAIQTKPDGGALPVILEKWIEHVITQISHSESIPLSDIRDIKYLDIIKNKLMHTINDITEIGGFDLGMVLIKYYEGYIKDDDQLRKNALKWLKGEYSTKTEARKDLGVRDIITDENYYDMLKNFCKLFVNIGYSGFMINLDEAINLYKISTSIMRDKNYEKLLSIYNDCYQGKITNLFFNFAGTYEVLENERRGLFSYNALKTRLESNKFETLNIRDFAQPVIKLLPLNHNEVFLLLQKIKAIFDLNYKTNINITDDDIVKFMEELHNKPGANEFLTPREVIKNYLNILSILRQNPTFNKNDLFEKIEIATTAKLNHEAVQVEEI